MDDMGQIRGENPGHEVQSYTNHSEFKSFDVEMEVESYDVEMVVSISSDEDIHDKIGTNECNKFGRSRGNVIKEEEKAPTGQEDNGSIKNSWNSKEK